MIKLIKEYAENRLALIKLEATEKSSEIIGGIVVYTLIAFIGLFFFILVNIGLGLLIGHYLDNYAYGILIMAGFYLLIALVLFIMKNSIKLRIINKLIKTLNP
ncbi:phage holin family protein [Bergeyella zoohelcum]|uniref:Holin-X, holin superfamily III n=2 Tax=Bergeyella zoohelcum TaxID=1015 RepID=K1M5B7_9FLAO|nr:phage holin family protein [Bergeyella zoohelcum]EKB57593.1 hypothetical protein HMPREF9699_01079 [Bergeyella zoohelcum ATCC 43767]EKB59756.1 hypothetical protein HMPREF9700_01262 [Bergeyella zoohelcum CCUG 30536]SUV48737.1 Protein of uncharacterised function (DUF1469) [Bergeyella zoohelcum]SUV52877.1 Protein of uncharacterised function (DUF1469) [Bergeyella zoohelcum]